MMKGLEEMAPESAFFARSKPWALGLAVNTGVLFGAALLGMSAELGILGWVLGLAATVASLMVSYWIVKGVRQTELVRGFDLQSARLKDLWVAMAVVNLLCYLIGWVPLVGWIGSIAGFLIGVCYLVAFYRTKKRYEDYTAV